MSVVVVVYDMARELPRTLRSLAPDYQRDIDGDAYEVVVVDNGSPEPVDPALVAAFPGRSRLLRIDPAPPSPARAANEGLHAATGELVGLIVDGARMASPGLLATARLAARLGNHPVIATLAWHLGPDRHKEAAATGWDQNVEDRLLAEIAWEEDGYRLFSASTLANSSGRGWFGPMGESSALFLTAQGWRDLDGLDERFVLPGGGLVNHDLYRRACSLTDRPLIMLLGEGTFHQYHGGATTSGRHGWEEMAAEYEQLRGEPHRPPDRQPLYVGSMPPEALEHVGRSVDLALARRARRAR
jgi:glycosyltransferase involved in cell wall biosynthesis